MGRNRREMNGFGMATTVLCKSAIQEDLYVYGASLRTFHSVRGGRSLIQDCIWWGSDMALMIVMSAMERTPLCGGWPKGRRFGLIQQCTALLDPGHRDCAHSFFFINKDQPEKKEWEFSRSRQRRRGHKQENGSRARKERL